MDEVKHKDYDDDDNDEEKTDSGKRPTLDPVNTKSRNDFSFGGKISSNGIFAGLSLEEL